MRRGLTIAALVGAATLCACDRPPQENSPPQAARLILPPGFTYDEDAIAEYGELDVAGRFIVENRMGAPLKATLRMRDWGIGLDEVEGETVEVTIPARGRVASEWIGSRARAVSMRLEGAGLISQTHHGLEYLGARVVVDNGPSALARVKGEIFTPAVEDQLPGLPGFVVDPSDPAGPASLRVGDFFRLVNETGVAMPAELRFESTTGDGGGSTTIMFVVIAAHGDCDLKAAERFDTVTIATPGRPLHADSLSKARISTGPVRLREGRVLEYRIAGQGENGEVREVSEARD